MRSILKGTLWEKIGFMIALTTFAVSFFTDVPAVKWTCVTIAAILFLVTLVSCFIPEKKPKRTMRGTIAMGNDPIEGDIDRKP